MIKFCAAILYTASLLPLYLQWSRNEAERQIDRMQGAVFNSPGAEAPITPAVVVGGITLMTSHMVIAHKILALSMTKSFFSLILGGIIGFLGWQSFADRLQNKGERP